MTTKWSRNQPTVISYPQLLTPLERHPLNWGCSHGVGAFTPNSELELHWSTWRLHGCQLICGWSIQFEALPCFFFYAIFIDSEFRYHLPGTTQALICWRISDSFGKLLAIDFVLQSNLLPARVWLQKTKAKIKGFIPWRIGDCVLWNGGTAVLGTLFNYHQLFKLHLEWSTLGSVLN